MHAHRRVNCLKQMLAGWGRESFPFEQSQTAMCEDKKEVFPPHTHTHECQHAKRTIIYSRVQKRIASTACTPCARCSSPRGCAPSIIQGVCTNYRADGFLWRGLPNPESDTKVTFLQQTCDFGSSSTSILSLWGQSYCNNFETRPPPRRSPGASGGRRSHDLSIRRQHRRCPSLADQA